jgi:hypothetical protein
LGEGCLVLAKSTASLSSLEEPEQCAVATVAVVQQLPTLDDLELVESEKQVLLQLQFCPVRGRVHEPGSALVLFDAGSTISLVRHQFAVNLGLRGQDCIQKVQPAGHGVENLPISSSWWTGRARSIIP